VATVSAGITAAIALTPIVSNPVTLVVYPGVYTEAPLTLPAFVNLASAGGAEVTEIAASTTTSPLLTAPAGIRITGMKFSGASGAGGVGVQFSTSGQRTRIDACLIVDCTVGLLASGTGAQVFADAIVILRRTGEVASEAFKAAAGGSMFCFSCRANGETGVLHTSGYVATGTGSVLTTNGGQAIFCTNGLQATLGGEIIAPSMRFEGCTNSRRVGPGANGILSTSSGQGFGVTWDALVDGATGKIEFGGDHVTQAKVSYLADTIRDGFFTDGETEGDEALVVIQELHVGSPEKGHESVFGEGDSYTRGMVVLTTDGTAGATADGGNLTDVSATAESTAGSTFTFQGVTAGHSILFGSSLIDSSSAVLKHWGLKLSQIAAAVEVTGRSFTFELWDGAAWVEVPVMATSASAYYPYANEVLVRANSTEHLRYGIDNATTWATKAINGDTLYWARVRISTTITTAPTFERVKLSCNRSEINADGTHTFHGSSRFRLSLAAGFSFGESGGVTNASFAVGSGGIPTGWTHTTTNRLLNQAADAIYTNFTIPQGTDTSQPIFFDLAYLIEASLGTAADVDLVLSVLPMEVVGVLVADPAFGLIPTARTLANIETLTAKAAQADSTSGLGLSSAVTGKLVKVLFGPFDISDYYAGDNVLLRLELADDGTQKADVLILALEINGVKWKHGDQL